MLAALQVFIAFGHQRLVLLAADLVNSLTEILGNMKFIEGNLLCRLRQALQRGIDIGWPHIHGDTLYCISLRFCQALIPCLERFLSTVTTHVQHATFFLV